MTLELGEHPVKAVEWALGYTSSGKEQIAVRVSFLDGPNQGKSATWYGFFSDAAYERTIESLRHLGWQGDDLSELAEGSENVHGMGTAQAIAVVQEDEYDGQVRARVAFINGAGALALKERMSPAEAKTFAARMRGRILGSDQRKGRSKPASGPRNDIPPHGDDDIPF